MQKRDVIRCVLDGKAPPYVPWSMSFTYEASETLKAYYGLDRLDELLDNHLLSLGNGIGFFTHLGGDLYQDVFGVVWDRGVDKDIGQVCRTAVPGPTLKGYDFPDPLDRRFYDDMPARMTAQADRYRVFDIGFSLYERAWTMRGLEQLMVDFLDQPHFVRDLLETIADYNIAQVNEAVRQGVPWGEIDAVYFGDDWGQQRGLQMGPRLWKQFLLPPLRRMYAAVHDAGKAVFIHSCGDVDELFDILIDAGVNCFNPFQPEVMDVYALMERYRGRLAFHGGLSTQRTLPYGTAQQVQDETRRLLDSGSQGGYIFAPAHSVEGDVPLENMLAFIETVQSQPGIH